MINYYRDCDSGSDVNALVGVKVWFRGFSPPEMRKEWASVMWMVQISRWRFWFRLPLGPKAREITPDWFK